MNKILYALALLAGTICLVVACSNDEPDTGNGNQDMEEGVPGTNHKILIAYFSQPLPNNVDAVTSASRVTVSRVLSQLARQGIIELGYSTIFVWDIEALNITWQI